MPTTTRFEPSGMVTTAGDDSISTVFEPGPQLNLGSTQTLLTLWPSDASRAYNVAPPPKSTSCCLPTVVTAADEVILP